MPSILLTSPVYFHLRRQGTEDRLQQLLLQIHYFVGFPHPKQQLHFFFSCGVYGTCVSRATMPHKHIKEDAAPAMQLLL
jgi:hypothetical protein